MSPSHYPQSKVFSQLVLSLSLLVIDGSIFPASFARRGIHSFALEKDGARFGIRLVFGVQFTRVLSEYVLPEDRLRPHTGTKSSSAVWGEGLVSGSGLGLPKSQENRKSHR